MKQITATLRPFMLDTVVCALHKIHDFPGATITEVTNIGKGFHLSSGDRARSSDLADPTFTRLNVVCSDALFDEILATIVQHADTGKADDGTIVVSTVDDAGSICDFKAR